MSDKLSNSGSCEHDFGQSIVAHLVCAGLEEDKDFEIAQETLDGLVLRVSALNKVRKVLDNAGIVYVYDLCHGEIITTRREQEINSPKKASTSLVDTVGNVVRDALKEAF